MFDESNTLASQIRQQWGGGNWDAEGVDRAQELSDLLTKAGVTSLGDLSLKDTGYVSRYGGQVYDPSMGPLVNDPGGSGMGYFTKDPETGMQSGWVGVDHRNQLQIGDKTLGYLGDYNNDGSYGSKAGDYLQPGDQVGWSARGHGNVTYRVVPNSQTGKLEIRPYWGSSSEASDVRTAAKVVGSVLGAGYGAEALAGAGGAGVAGVGATEAGAAAGGLSSADLAALYGAEGYGAGLTGAETAAFDAGLGGAAGSSLGGSTSSSLGGSEFNPEGITNPNFGQGADFAQVSSGNGGGMASGQWIDGISNNSLVNLGGNLLSGWLGSSASKNAVNAQLQAGRDSNALQKYEYDTTRSDFAPYRAAGTSALGQIQALLANPNSITGMPDYQFGLDQGTKTLNNGAAARGMTYSGAQGKALQRYGQDYAGTKLNESYNRLASIAGIGQQATGSTANAGQNYANQVGETTVGMGNARGSGYVGSANAWGNAFGNALNNYNQQNMLDRYYGQGG